MWAPTQNMLIYSCFYGTEQWLEEDDEEEKKEE